MNQVEWFRANELENVQNTLRDIAAGYWSDSILDETLRAVDALSVITTRDDAKPYNIEQFKQDYMIDD